MLVSDKELIGWLIEGGQDWLFNFTVNTVPSYVGLLKIMRIK